MIPNIDRLTSEIDQLASFSSHPSPAVTRILFSPEDLNARTWLINIAEQSGFICRNDAVGNLFITWPGSHPSLPPIATGSHTDAIPNAGKFDGVVGVLGALEAMRTLREAGHTPRHSIELIMFTAEEPTRFGIGCLGSRMLSHSLSPSAASLLRDTENQSLEQLRPTSFPDSLDSVAIEPGCYQAFIELHIEQGPLLDANQLDIGIVEKIAAPSAYRVHFSGTGGHAGAVLMPGRNDALLAAAELALATERAAIDSPSPDTVATTGVIDIAPGAINSIPCSAMIEIDLRDTNPATRDLALTQIKSTSTAISERRGVAITWETINSDPPATCDPTLVSKLELLANSLGYKHTRMISRAYHDSLFMARLCPTAMIFIPSHRGYSHRPDEFSSPDAIAKGTTLLTEILRQLSA